MPTRAPGSGRPPFPVGSWASRAALGQGRREASRKRTLCKQPSQRSSKLCDSAEEVPMPECWVLGPLEKCPAVTLGGAV